MKCSIIITTLNRSATLTQRSLRSALMQKFDDFEVLVVDDGSQDDTLRVLQQYPDVRVLSDGKNHGLSYARNWGAREARGDYVVFLDDDNELLPDFLYETYTAARNVDAVCTGRIVKYVEKNFEHRTHAYPPGNEFISMDWGWLIRRGVFNTIQYDEKMMANEDADFGLRFARNGFTYASVDKPLGIAFDEGDPKLSMSYPTQRTMEGMEYYLKKNLHHYEGNPNELRYLYRMMGRRWYLYGHRALAIHYFIRSFAAKPGINSFLHLVAILLGWRFYDLFMTLTERLQARN